MCFVLFLLCQRCRLIQRGVALQRNLWSKPASPRLKLTKSFGGRKFAANDNFHESYWLVNTGLWVYYNPYIYIL